MFDAIFLLSVVFRDKATPSPFIEVIPNDDGTAKEFGKPDHIYMDCMGFGMGSCCLQVSGTSLGLLIWECV